MATIYRLGVRIKNAGEILGIAAVQRLGIALRNAAMARMQAR